MQPISRVHFQRAFGKGEKGRTETCHFRRRFVEDTFDGKNRKQLKKMAVECLIFQDGGQGTTDVSFQNESLGHFQSSELERSQDLRLKGEQ